MKLQDAYITENGDYMGSFKSIGYEMDSSSVFGYSSAITEDKKDLASQTDAWKATSKSALNDCPKNATWSLKLDPSATGNGAAWTASYSDQSNCKVLTPRFSDLTRGTAKSGNSTQSGN